MRPSYGLDITEVPIKSKLLTKNTPGFPELYMTELSVQVLVVLVLTFLQVKLKLLSTENVITSPALTVGQVALVA
jgi:hypothetical protein